MTFRNLMDFLVKEKLDVSAIAFKEGWMENWYTPSHFVRDGSITQLICTTPSRKDLARFGWSEGSRLKDLKVKMSDLEKITRRRVLSSGVKIKILLTD